jgi:hypothetical protein
VILQREVDQSADAFDVLDFKVSPSQVISLKTFDFSGLSFSEVETGVLPLIISPLSSLPNPPRGSSQATTHRPIPMTSVVSLPMGPCPQPTPTGSRTRRDTSR